MPDGLKWLGLGLALFLFSAPAVAQAPEEPEGRLHLGAALHGALLDMKEAWGGGLNMELRAIYHPIPELGLGLRAGCMLPLRLGEDAREARAALRVLPGAWLRFGSAQAWGYLALGLGYDAHLCEDSSHHSLLLGALAGYAVAPSSLPFYFGFEMSGELNLAGDPLRAIGIGAFVAWRL